MMLSLHEMREFCISEFCLLFHCRSDSGLNNLVQDGVDFVRV